MVLLQGLAAEVAASVGLPTHLQPLKMFAPDIIGLEALDTLLRESVHGRFVAGARRTANLTVPRSARGELRVPRLENVNPGAAANLSVPSAVRWTTPFVRHSLVLRHRPAVDLGGDPSNIYREFVVPPSGSSVDEMLTSSEWVRLYAVPAHVDLFEELHRMWVGKDNPQVVAAAALNCVLLVDVERLARNGPSSSGVCELGGFHAFAARMLAPHPDDARDGVRPSHNAFLAWLAATFGAGNRDEFARNCVHTVVPYWPILHDYLPLDMLQNLFDARAAFFASAFVRIHALSVPVDGPVQAGSTHPHHGHPHHAHS
ncbi:hypothetical protein DMC30DRAFT_94150 [Rhodotorula diobovata]|uniref:Uncharacterized protein n=1 Tax=Rhodotorula diobovata TaxID=5288 RepID=A0A5C5G4R7_9BASI|nr:hypothetical protein DMC30DRAFT_94150 [Rhodotorula diobovata]